MGQPKQLLQWGNQTLIEHQIHIRLQTGQDVGVVLGAHADKILAFIEKLPVTVFINMEWQAGMGNSLAFGLKMLHQKFPEMEGVLISLLDQPLISISHLEELNNRFQTGNRQIIVSQSDSGWIGVPALFDRFYFEVLNELKGKEGAKEIIQKHRNSVIPIECGKSLEDIDTPESYRILLEKFRKQLQ